MAEWIYIPLNVSNDKYGMNKYNTRKKCSNCGFVTSTLIEYDNCPNCGEEITRTPKERGGEK